VGNKYAYLSIPFFGGQTNKQMNDFAQPDLTIIGGDAFFDHARDKKIIAAIRWFKRQP
jgi:hypothetical protein